MTNEEYWAKKEEIDKEFRKKNRELDVEFALSHNDIKDGDIVSDGSTTIVVEKIRVHPSWGSGLPYVYFEGTRLTRKLEPFKSKEIGTVFTIKKHIKQKI